jgi:transketolase N-terminal domain/subunit
MVVAINQFVLRKGRRYRAAISLGIIQSMATNELIASRLESFGFSDVIVRGHGGRRTVEVLWLKADHEANMPKEITYLEEVI